MPGHEGANRRHIERGPRDADELGEVDRRVPADGGLGGTERREEYPDVVAAALGDVVAMHPEGPGSPAGGGAQLVVHFGLEKPVPVDRRRAGVVDDQRAAIGADPVKAGAG